MIKSYSSSLKKCITLRLFYQESVLVKMMRQFSMAASQVSKPQETETKRPSPRPRYCLVASTLLERVEVITKDLTSYEKEYKEFADAMYLEKSKYSIAEIDALQAAKKAQALLAQKKANRKRELKRKGKVQDKEDTGKKETAELAMTGVEETEDSSLDANAMAWATEHGKETFVPASRVTEADNANNRHSTERRLQDILYLIVKQKGGTTWDFPLMAHSEEESLRKTAEVGLQKAVDQAGHMKVSFTSNRPLGVETIKMSPLVTKDLAGSKIFFFHAYWLSGDVDLDINKYEDYAWVTANEMSTYFAPKHYKHVFPLMRE